MNTPLVGALAGPSPAGEGRARGSASGEGFAGVLEGAMGDSASRPDRHQVNARSGRSDNDRSSAGRSEPDRTTADRGATDRAPADDVVSSADEPATRAADGDDTAQQPSSAEVADPVVADQPTISPDAEISDAEVDTDAALLAEVLPAIEDEHGDTADDLTTEAVMLAGAAPLAEDVETDLDLDLGLAVDGESDDGIEVESAQGASATESRSQDPAAGVAINTSDATSTPETTGATGDTLRASTAGAVQDDLGPTQAAATDAPEQVARGQVDAAAFRARLSGTAEEPAGDGLTTTPITGVASDEAPTTKSPDASAATIAPAIPSEPATTAGTSTEAAASGSTAQVTTDGLAKVTPGAAEAAVPDELAATQAPIAAPTASTASTAMAAETATTSAAGRPSMLPAAANQVATAVAAMKRRGDGNYVASLDLHPSELGRVRVEVQLRNGVVSISMAAEQAQTRVLFSQGLDDLRSALEQGGMNAGDLDVSQQSFTSGEERGDTQGQAADADNNSSSLIDLGVPAALPTDLGSTPLTAAAGGLDVRL